MNRWNLLRIRMIPLAAIVLCSAPVFAQTSQGSPLGEEKITQFADAYIAVEEVHASVGAELAKAEDPAEADQVRTKGEARMLQALESSGMRVQEFNQIVELIALDPALRMKVAARVEERRRV